LLQIKLTQYARLIFNALKLLISCEFTLLFSKLKKKFRKAEENDTTIFIDDLLKSKVKSNDIYNKEVDIIIPIFNGLDFLKNLFISLKKNTDVPYRLILIDDKSTDAKINLFLKAQVKSFKNAILISNEQNLGFVKSANKGFSLVKSEFFILLNSDTQVPKKWLSRMIRPLVLEGKLASVTPFSSEATIFSFPDEKLNKNKIYQNLSVSEIDQAFTQLPLLNSVIKVPTTVGFCMGIRSKCVRQVGFFDEIFGRGYGEENDWCIRAAKAGFYHGAVNNLYVYHKMKGSFSKEEKTLLLKKNLRILNKKYPSYPNLINDFYKQDPLRYIKDLADFLLPNSANNILIIDHDLGGGANVYRNELIETLLRKNSQVILITDNRISGHMSVVFYTKRIKLPTRLRDPRLLRKLFELFSIDEVIYNNAVNSRNPIGLINEILNLKKIFDFRINTLVHDFFPICPSFTLIDKDGRYCGVPKNIKTCEACIKKLNPTYSQVIHKNQNIHEWRSLWGELIRSSYQVTCFSNSTKEILLKVYPFAKNLIKVIPHLVNFTPSKLPSIKKGKLHIGVIGGMSYAKGASVLNQLVNFIEERKLQIKVTLLGEIDPAFHNAKMNVLGKYQRHELPYLIEKNEINVILFPSIFPETFSYVTSEVMIMKMPIAYFDIGAVPEKLKSYEKGSLLGLGMSHEEIIDALNALNKRSYLKESYLT
jgi:GT2 family glycosyltransferase